MLDSGEPAEEGRRKEEKADENRKKKKRQQESHLHSVEAGRGVRNRAWKYLRVFR